MDELMDILGEPDWVRVKLDPRLEENGCERWQRYDGLIEIQKTSGIGFVVGIRDEKGYLHVTTTQVRRWRNPHVLLLVFNEALKAIKTARSSSLADVLNASDRAWMRQDLTEQIDRIRAVRATIVV